MTAYDRDHRPPRRRNRPARRGGSHSASIPKVPIPASDPSAPPSAEPGFWQTLDNALDSDVKVERLKSVLVPLLNRGCLMVMGVVIIVVTATRSGVWWSVL